MRVAMAAKQERASVSAGPHEPPHGTLSSTLTALASAQPSIYKAPGAPRPAAHGLAPLGVLHGDKGLGHQSLQ